MSLKVLFWVDLWSLVYIMQVFLGRVDRSIVMKINLGRDRRSNYFDLEMWNIHTFGEFDHRFGLTYQINIICFIFNNPFALLG